MIMSENLGKMTPLMKLFWEQQKQFTKNKSATSNRYHPMIIRFCLSLASKSASACGELRPSNVLTLPSCRTLRDYKNAIKPHADFNPYLYQPSWYICFFADTPNLMKTTRNCMYHSGSGAGKTRLMWNDGREIVWNHLVRAVQD